MSRALACRVHPDQAAPAAPSAQALWCQPRHSVHQRGSWAAAEMLDLVGEPCLHLQPQISKLLPPFGPSRLLAAAPRLGELQGCLPPAPQPLAVSNVFHRFWPRVSASTAVK